MEKKKIAWVCDVAFHIVNGRIRPAEDQPKENEKMHLISQVHLELGKKEILN